MTLTTLRSDLRTFVQNRDWAQFHTPKNLTMALSVEAAELMEHFQWLTGEESAELSEEKLAEVGEELGDVLIYLVRLADVLEIDLLQAAQAKLERNREKYPADKVRGQAWKYDEY